VALGVVGGGGAAGEVPCLENGGAKVGMFQGNAGIQDADLDPFALGLFPEWWNPKELETPVDGFSRGEHDLVDLEGREAIDGRWHGHFHKRSVLELKLKFQLGRARFILNGPC